MSVASSEKGGDDVSDVEVDVSVTGTKKRMHVPMEACGEDKPSKGDDGGSSKGDAAGDSAADKKGDKKGADKKGDKKGADKKAPEKKAPEKKPEKKK